MIEEVTKAERRGKVVDEDYIDQLYEEVKSLYRLDQVNNKTTSSDDLGPLPVESKVLIISLVCVWIIIGAYYFIDQRKSRL